MFTVIYEYTNLHIILDSGSLKNTGAIDLYLLLVTNRLNVNG